MRHREVTFGYNARMTKDEKLLLYGPGPWVEEPDRLEWKSAQGLPCLIVRNPRLGVLCGYVAVPPEHPMHGCGLAETHDLRVHGGVTYAEACQGDICHVPEPGEPDDVWWLGFDAGHAFDEQPLIAKVSPALRSLATYRDVAYMRAQCESLAEQLGALAQRAR